MNKRSISQISLILFSLTTIVLFQNCAGGIEGIDFDSATIESPETELLDNELGTAIEENDSGIESHVPVSECLGYPAGQNINTTNATYDIAKIRKNFGPKILALGFTCPIPPTPPEKFDPPVFYLSDGVTPNPLFYSHMQPFNDYISKLNQLGDLYLSTQANVVADCVLNWTSAWAHTNLLTEYNIADYGRLNYSTTQGDYERKWLVGEILFNFAKIKNSTTVLNVNKVNAVKNWLGRSMTPIRLFYDNRIRYNPTTRIMERPQNLNNHQYWAGLTVLLYGILFNDVSHQDWGKLQYKLGVDSIQNNGTLATELSRGRQAFIYHQFALQPLVMIAELSTIHGQNLYTYNSSRLNLLAGLMIRSFENYSNFTSLTTSVQLHTPQSMINDLPYYLDWMEIWYSRYANTRLSQFILKARSSLKSPDQKSLNNFRLGGNMTLAWGVRQCHIISPK